MCLRCHLALPVTCSLAVRPPVLLRTLLISFPLATSQLNDQEIATNAGALPAAADWRHDRLLLVAICFTLVTPLVSCVSITSLITTVKLITVNVTFYERNVARQATPEGRESRNEYDLGVWRNWRQVLAEKYRGDGCQWPKNMKSD